jgi:hypothetical protein
MILCLAILVIPALNQVKNDKNENYNYICFTSPEVINCASGLCLINEKITCGY